MSAGSTRKDQGQCCKSKCQTKSKSKSKYEAGTWSDQAAPLSREERRGRAGRKSLWESGAPPRRVIVVSLSVRLFFIELLLRPWGDFCGVPDQLAIGLRRQTVGDEFGRLTIMWFGWVFSLWGDDADVYFLPRCQARCHCHSSVQSSSLYLVLGRKEDFR